MLNEALQLAAKGLHVFPLQAKKKEPFENPAGTPKGEGGVKLATTNPDALRTVWQNIRNQKGTSYVPNIGIALGEKSGVVALDVDFNHGAELKWVEELITKHLTVVVRTGNGCHIYFKWHKDLKNGTIMPGVDPKQDAVYLRANGYYVVAPPSIHPDGAEYRYWDHLAHPDGGLSFFNLMPAEFPEELLPKAKPVSRAEKYGPNSRHDLFKRTAVAMASKGKSADEILAELHKRNLKDCNPPKEDCDKELRNIVDWALLKVEKQPTFESEEEYLIPLGHNGTDYFYTTSSNRQIICLGRASHSSTTLVDLMPYSFWAKKYGTEKGGVAWAIAASDLMEACRDAGIFNSARMRGLGAWREGGELVLHLGDRLWYKNQEVPLNNFPSCNIYQLGPTLETPNLQPATLSEARILVEACKCLNWHKASSGMFLAGALAVARLCGALPWRPMLWLTGPAGSGKSTVMDRIVNVIGGDHALYIVGNTTEAGIRQALGCDARPVIFDEAETNDKRSSHRMKAVMELIRQAASDSEARILKGTADGRGHRFKINSAFILSSIRVNLSEESDRTRFAVLELLRNDPANWEAVEQKINLVSPELAEKLFARSLKLFPLIMQAKDLFGKEIAKQATQREAQQYGILLAGYWSLLSDILPSEMQVKNVIRDMDRKKPEDSNSSDEMECLERLLQIQIRYSDTVTSQWEMSLGAVLLRARTEHPAREALRALGFDATDKAFLISATNVTVDKAFANTKWDGLWMGSLARIKNAQRGIRHRFSPMRQSRALSIPIEAVFTPSGSSDESPDPF